MAPGPVLDSLGINPAADAQLTLGDFDLVVLAFFGLAARTIVGGNLYIFSQLLNISILRSCAGWHHKMESSVEMKRKWTASGAKRALGKSRNIIHA